MKEEEREIEIVSERALAKVRKASKACGAVKALPVTMATL